MSVGVMEQIWRRFMFPRYGNSLPFPMNRRYALYNEKCRRGYTDGAATPASELAQKVSKDGFVQIHDAIASDKARAMSERVSKLIAAEPASKKRGRTAHLQYRVNDPIRTLGSEALELFRGPADAVLRAYFKSWYRLYSVACYRSVPSSDPQGAWLWHIDNYPPAVKKIMLYLTDCEPKLGTTSFVSPAQTKALRGSGYFGIYPYERSEDLSSFAARAKIDPNIQTCTIEAGSALFFDNNTLHRANIPEVGFRDVITFTVLPSDSPWDKVLDGEGIAALEARTSMYPNDPSRL